MLSSLLNDYMLFLKIFVFFYFVRWAMEKFGSNRFLFVLALLIGGYYILFARWNVLGILAFLFLIFIMSGVGNFMQDIIFQYDSVRATEMEGAEMNRPMTFMERLRRF